MIRSGIFSVLGLLSVTMAGAGVPTCPGPEPVAAPLVIPNDESRATGIVWNGQEFAVVYRAIGSNTELIRIGMDGLQVGNPVVVSDRWTIPPSLVWNGGGYMLVGNGPSSPIPPYGDLRASILNEQGVPLAMDVIFRSCVSGSCLSPHLVRAGGDYQVVWFEWVSNTAQIFSLRLTQSGFVRSGSLRQITSTAGDSFYPRVAGAGDTYGVVWADARHGDDEIYFQAMNAAGRLVGENVRITDAPGDSEAPDIVWNGGHFGLLWSDSRSGDALPYFAQIDQHGGIVTPGTPVASESIMTTVRLVSLAWTGAEYGAAWTDGTDYSARFVRVASDGEILIPDIPMSTADADKAVWPRLAWAGDRFGAAWTRMQLPGNDPNSLVVSQVLCPCLTATDSDSDGQGDPCDNCLLAYNPTQEDMDVDGEGDGCDLDDGFILADLPDPGQVQWQDEQGFASWNAYRGDLAGLLGPPGHYTQAPGSNPLAAQSCELNATVLSDPDVLDPGQVAFYLVTGIQGQNESSLGENSMGIERSTAHPCP